MKPHVLARSNNKTARSPFPSLASLKSYVTTPVCSIQPGMPGAPPFGTDWSMYSFSITSNQTMRQYAKENFTFHV